MADANTYRIAIATSDGIVVNQHFGRADTFYIYEVEEDGGHRLLEKRSLVPVCNRGNHDDDAMQKNVELLKDCRYVLASRIGMGAATVLEQSGITPMELPGMLEEAIEKLVTYQKIQNLF